MTSVRNLCDIRFSLFNTTMVQLAHFNNTSDHRSISLSGLKSKVEQLGLFEIPDKENAKNLKICSRLSWIGKNNNDKISNTR